MKTYRIQGRAQRIHDTGYKGSSYLTVGYRVPDTGYRVHDTGFTRHLYTLHTTSSVNRLKALWGTVSIRLYTTQGYDRSRPVPLLCVIRRLFVCGSSALAAIKKTASSSSRYQPNIFVVAVMDVALVRSLPMNSSTASIVSCIPPGLRAVQRGYVHRAFCQYLTET